MLSNSLAIESGNTEFSVAAGALGGHSLPHCGMELIVLSLEYLEDQEAQSY